MKDGAFKAWAEQVVDRVGLHHKDVFVCLILSGEKRRIGFSLQGRVEEVGGACVREVLSKLSWNVYECSSIRHGICMELHGMGREISMWKSERSSLVLQQVALRTNSSCSSGQRK